MVKYGGSCGLMWRLLLWSSMEAIVVVYCGLMWRLLLWSSMEAIVVV